MSFFLLLSLVYAYVTISERNNAEEREAREKKKREEKEREEKEKKEMEKKKRKKQNAKLNQVLPATALTSTQGKVNGISSQNHNNMSQQVAASSPYFGPSSAFTGGVPLGSQQHASGLGLMQQRRPAPDKVRTFDPSMVKNSSSVVPAALITQEGVSPNVSTAPLGSGMRDMAVQGMLPINQDLPTELFTLPKAKAITAESPYASKDTLKLCNRLKVAPSELAFEDCPQVFLLSPQR